MLKVKNLKFVLISPLIFAFINCKVEIPMVNKATIFKNGTASLSGVIKEFKELSPVSDVDLKLNDKTTKSDKNGFYLFKNILPGEYTLTLSKLGYDTTNFKININGDIKSDFLIRLSQNSNPAVINPTPQLSITPTMIPTVKVSEIP